MKQQHTLVKTFPLALIVAFFATRRVRGRFGDETFVCDASTCDLGSGMTWLLSGVTILGPFIAIIGFMCSRRLHHNDRLGPFSYRAFPDAEQILEVLGVLAAMALSYWLILNGPGIELATSSSDPTLAERPNWFAEWLREFRAPEVRTAEARDKLDEVPSRRTWFLIGTLLGAPFMFSFGSMLGREWYGRKRRKAQREDDVAGGENAIDHIDLTDTSTSGRSSADLELDLSIEPKGDNF